MFFRRFGLLFAALSLVIAGQGCFQRAIPSDGEEPSTRGNAQAALVAEITEVQGMVILTRNGEEIGAEVHTRIQAGDRLETKEGSGVAVEFYAGSRMALDEQASVTIDEAFIDPSNWKKQVVRLTLQGGRVWNRALKLLDLDSSYRVEYENTIASVRGTAFLVTGAEHRLTIDEFDGNIDMIGSVSGTLSEGFTVNVHTNDPPADLTPVMMPTPDQTRNDPFVHRQMKADEAFADEAGRIRGDLGADEDVSRVGHELGLYTLDQPGAEHSGFTRVDIEAVEATSLDDGTAVMLDGADQQLKAYAVFIDANGERRVDVTNSGVVWQLEHPSSGVISPTGLFHSAVGYMGPVYIVARYNDGTHEHSGMIHIEAYTKAYIESIMPDFSIF